MKNCPTCHRELREVQVLRMLGNPDYNEWCRNGYCSQECFEERSSDDQLIEIVPRNEEDEAPVGEEGIPRRRAFREFDSYAFANLCLLAVPFGVLIGAIGAFTGAYQSPLMALCFIAVVAMIFGLGLVSGVVALFGIKKHGVKGIFWKTMIGFILIMLGSSSLLSSFQ